LADALTALDPDHRDVLLLFAWEGLAYHEIAQVLEMPVGTVRSRLSRARERLRAHLATGSEIERPSLRVDEQETADDR
jgi:RNA polymerase sigma factor (sigma-70 family)